MFGAQFAYGDRIPHPERDAHPLRIYTFGRFSITHHSKPIEFGRKAPVRSLQLLKLLISLGGRAVPVDALSRAMWSHADGEVARNAFEITLHRLRRLLRAEKTLLLSSGQLTLNERNCWVDVWEFERAINRVDSLLHSPAPDPDQLVALSSRAFTLYKDHFLGSETPEPWVLAMRERLRGKFCRYLLGVARHWEQLGAFENAIRCYEKGIELDNLATVCMERLKFCYEQLGRRGDAEAMYRL